ncbi:hypothetical protein BOSEA31B_11815 [Hyphomicrobiales bacterium]|nr:hypothetical protein BOSEA31B_11815 [Hyphomicrobiales bacterium]CAH1697595.1 hypothetical protein BOSEA1005_10640 [Hyphomicrobiales bacterium]CAI0347242.1 hypothetical protein BO1005MUT1_70023 [Hyphomicrobiales bacterium]
MRRKRGGSPASRRSVIARGLWSFRRRNSTPSFRSLWICGVPEGFDVQRVGTIDNCDSRTAQRPAAFLTMIRKEWRTGRDSNPRYGFPYTHFPGVRLQPLGHLSGALLMTAAPTSFKARDAAFCTIPVNHASPVALLRRGRHI